MNALAPTAIARPPRIPRSTARLIDRLARRAHAFHRFAHHPLCPAYAGELLQLGRRNRVCRGCAYVALGFTSGIALGFALPTAPLVAPLLALTCVSLAVVSLARRLPKALSRLAPAAVGSALLVVALRSGGFELYIAGGSALAGLGVILLYRRRGPDRTPCASCPERTLAIPCTGYAPIVRRERAFRRLADRWLTVESRLARARR